MRALFIGGGKSGKSTAAQKLAAALADGGPLYYWATMTPHDGEDEERIQRHRDDRAGMGFTTVERSFSLPDGLTAEIELGTWPVLPVFTELQKLGGLGDRQIYNTFNMGIGMVFAVSAQEADALMASLEASGEQAYRIGRVVKTGEDGERLVLR